MNKLLNLRELGAKLSMSPETLRRLYRRKHISGFRLGWRTLLFDPQDVLNSLKGRTPHKAPTKPLESPAKAPIMPLFGAIDPPKGHEKLADVSDLDIEAIEKDFSKYLGH